MKRNITVWVLSVFSGCFFFCSEGFGQYQIIDLGTLPGGTQSQAYGLNDMGQVTGCSRTVTDDWHAFSYQNGIMTDLDTFGGPESMGYSVNNRGQITGYIIYTLLNHLYGQAFLNSDGVMKYLGGLTEGVGHAINDNGDVAGTLGSARHAFFFSNEVMHDLGSLAGDNEISEGWGINNNKEVVGITQVPVQHGVESHAFIYSNGIMKDLGTLGGDYSFGRAINDSSQIVGWSRTAEGYEHAFVSSNSIMKDLGTLGGIRSQGCGINDLGQITGWSTDLNEQNRAFFYSNDIMIDLNTLIDPRAGWSLDVAYDINNYGQIVGFGMHNGQERAFLMTPIPEPCTLALLALGGVGLLRKRRR